MMSCLLHCVSHSLENNSEYLVFRHWRIINYLEERSIFNKGQGKKLSVRFKGFKFVLDHEICTGFLP